MTVWLLLLCGYVFNTNKNGSYIYREREREREMCVYIYYKQYLWFLKFYSRHSLTETINYQMWNLHNDELFFVSVVPHIQHQHWRLGRHHHFSELCWKCAKGIHQVYLHSSVISGVCQPRMCHYCAPRNGREKRQKKERKKRTVSLWVHNTETRLLSFSVQQPVLCLCISVAWVQQFDLLLFSKKDDDELTKRMILCCNNL